MTESALDRLRNQLLDMRDGLIGRLAERIEGGDLALLGSVGGALRAIDDLLAEQDDEAEAA